MGKGKIQKLEFEMVIVCFLLIFAGFGFRVLLRAGTGQWQPGNYGE